MEESQFQPVPPSQPQSIPTGKRELCFAPAILAAALCLTNFTLYGGLHLGFALAMAAVLAVSWGYLEASGCRGDWYTRSMLALCIVIAAGFCRSDDYTVKLVMLGFLFAGGNGAFAIMAGQNRFHPGGGRSLFDALATPFRFGYGKMGRAVRGIAAAFREGSSLTRRSGAVLAGLAIAVPALAIVIPLLISADAAFDGLIALLPDLQLDELASTAFYGSFMALFYYSRAVGLRHTEADAAQPKSRKGLHPLTVNTALGAVCLVYVVYLCSQLAYFVGGFAGILPQGYSAAEYARRGFFEMTQLCAINLGLIVFAVALVSRQDRAPLSTRVLCLFVGLVTLFFVAASAAKMSLYIGLYGLTRLRVLTMVVMAFLAVTTVLVAVWLFVPKLQYMKAVMLVGLAMGAAVIWADIDTQVAKYNVTAYLSGELDSIDVSHLWSLGDGALPWIAELSDCGDPDVEETVRSILEHERSWRFANENDDFRSWNWATAQAEALLED